jgi:hypothetical protein
MSRIRNESSVDNQPPPLWPLVAVVITPHPHGYTVRRKVYAPLVGSHIAKQCICDHRMTRTKCASCMYGVYVRQHIFSRFARPPPSDWVSGAWVTEFVMHGWMLAGCWLDAGWMLAGCWLDAGWMPARCWLDADLG